MRKQPVASSRWPVAKELCSAFSLQATSYKLQAGFTLIETLVAISLLSVAIVAPMSLVSQSLAAATYSRDQVAAYNLAQEGIESVRGIRDGNILANALQSQGKNLLDGIPIGGNFTIDARETNAADAIDPCDGPCQPLQTDGTLYGYEANWQNTGFTRTLTAVYVGPLAQNGGEDAIRVSATVSWFTPNGQPRSFTIYENMYRWVDDGSAAQ